MLLKHKMALAAVSIGLLAGGPALAQDYTLPATYGEITLNGGFSPDPTTVDVVAGGTTDASALGNGCNGFISTAPDFQLTYNPTSYPLYFSVLSDADTTLVINGPDGGWYCNDDTNGLNPVVEFPGTAPSGTYDVWVGTYGNTTAPAVLYISELSAAAGGGGGGGTAGGPDMSLPATYGEVTINSGFTPDPMTVEVVAGGGNDAGLLDGTCNGLIATAPDYQITYTAGSYPLIISVLSQTDTTLVINGPDGQWYCNDDYDDLNPAVFFDPASSGTYDIWVGTYSDGNAPATLYISELTTGAGNGNTPGPVTTGPNPNLEPNYGQVNLQAGFPAVVREIDAGGTVSAFDIPSGECRGYIAEAPDLAVDFATLAGILPLNFAVTSTADTTLVIMNPAGDFLCADDTDGVNPAVSVSQPQAGRYLVWVGTYSQDGTYPAATLTVSTLGGGGK